MSDATIRPAGLSALPGIVAGFSTRAYAPPETHVDDLRGLVAAGAGFEQFAGVRQVHGNAVAVVRGEGIVPEHDAIVTDEADLLLTVVAADCALILLADPGAGVIGAAHSGWRGTVAGVLPRTIEAMAALGGAPERLHAWIAPCISTEAFEVGDEVAEHFAPSVVARRPEWPRPHVDLRAALRAQLDAAGVPAANVEVDDRCPALDTATFYSYRAEGGTPGRMIGYIGRRSAS